MDHDLCSDLHDDLYSNPNHDFHDFSNHDSNVPAHDLFFGDLGMEGRIRNLEIALVEVAMVRTCQALVKLKFENLSEIMIHVDEKVNQQVVGNQNYPSNMYVNHNYRLENGKISSQRELLKVMYVQVLGCVVDSLEDVNQNFWGEILMKLVSDGFYRSIMAVFERRILTELVCNCV